MSLRLNKVNSLVKKIVSQIISQGLDSSELRMYLYTVTQVKVTADLHSAEIYVSVLGGNDSKTGYQLLCRKLKKIQQIFATRIRLKYTPKLHLNLDESAEYAFHINEVINKIHEQESKH